MTRRHDEIMVEVFITRTGHETTEVLVPRIKASAHSRQPATVGGPTLPGEHPCETAWRLVAGITGSPDACVSFRRLSSLHDTTHFFQTALEDESIAAALAANYEWQHWEAL